MRIALYSTRFVLRLSTLHIRYILYCTASRKLPFNFNGFKLFFLLSISFICTFARYFIIEKVTREDDGIMLHIYIKSRKIRQVYFNIAMYFFKFYSEYCSQRYHVARAIKFEKPAACLGVAAAKSGGFASNMSLAHL